MSHHVPSFEWITPNFSPNISKPDQPYHFESKLSQQSSNPLLPDPPKIVMN